MATKVAFMIIRRAPRVTASLSRNGHFNVNSYPALDPMLPVAVRSVGTCRLYSSDKSAEPKLAAQAVDEAVIKKYLDEIEMLNKELAELKEKHLEVTDKYKRSLADGENLRVRLTKQINDAKVFGIQNFCKDLLEVADILGHATAAVPKDKVNETPVLKALYEGLVMTQASLAQTFKRNGLEQMNPLNEKFNPNFHEALFQKDEPGVPPNTIIEVTKLGYKLHDRIIRPALVGVSKAS